MALPHAASQFLPLPLLQSPELTLSQKIRAKLQNPDLLELCHSVPKEVVQLGEPSEPKMALPLLQNTVEPQGCSCPPWGVDVYRVSCCYLDQASSLVRHLCPLCSPGGGQDKG